MEASVVAFGNLSFAEQVLTAGQADVLVGITGSDLINLMFLPQFGSVVEIFPSYQQHNVFTPELYNMARMLGKNHLTYISAHNVTVTGDERDEATVSRLLHNAKFIEVSIPHLGGFISTAVQQARGGSIWARTNCLHGDEALHCQQENMDVFTRDAFTG